MITKNEISKIATEKGVKTSIIDKDWVLGHFIDAIFSIPECRKEKANVTHPYSDKLTENAEGIPVYSINEMLAEKFRALIQRSYSAPRDYYDIWYLSKNMENNNWDAVVEAFFIKTVYKNLDFSGIEQLINSDNDKILKSAWKNSLGHQIAKEKLPDYYLVKNDLLSLFTEVFMNQE